MSALDDWMTAACAALELEARVDQRVVLDVARDVAHHVLRPAAPLSAYLLGVAVGRGAEPAAAAAALTDLARGWPAAHSPDAGEGRDSRTAEPSPAGVEVAEGNEASPAPAPDLARGPDAQGTTAANPAEVPD
jgi:hypothetical protein